MKNLTLLFLGLFLGLGWSQDYEMYDIKKIISPDECKICHKKEYEVWQTTTHFKSYDDLHLNPVSEQIMKRLRMEGSVRQQESCRRCHYTLQVKGTRIRTVEAVACERCHGPAKDWVEVHNVAEVPLPQRRINAQKLGMFNPGNVIGIANNCYSCHVIDDETLIDVGRHPLGDESFKFLTHSQGKMRHNFTSGGGENIPASIERKRLFHIISTTLEIEHRLRALAKAKNEKNFFLYTRNQLKKNAEEMLEIHKVVNRSETKHILEVLQKIKATSNNEEELSNAGDEVGKVARLLINNYDVSKLESIDQLIPKK